MESEKPIEEARRVWDELGIDQRYMDQQEIQSCIDYLETVINLTREEGRREGLEAAAKEIPTTWLDPLLSGKDCIKDFNGDGLERFCQSLIKRIRALATDEAAKA